MTKTTSSSPSTQSIEPFQGVAHQMDAVGTLSFLDPASEKTLILAACSTTRCTSPFRCLRLKYVARCRRRRVETHSLAMLTSQSLQMASPGATSMAVSNTMISQSWRTSTQRLVPAPVSALSTSMARTSEPTTLSRSLAARLGRQKAKPIMSQRVR